MPACANNVKFKVNDKNILIKCTLVKVVTESKISIKDITDSHLNGVPLSNACVNRRIRTESSKNTVIRTVHLEFSYKKCPCRMSKHFRQGA